MRLESVLRYKGLPSKEGRPDGQESLVLDGGYLTTILVFSRSTGARLFRLIERMPLACLAMTSCSSTSVGSVKDRPNLPWRSSVVWTVSASLTGRSSHLPLMVSSPSRRVRSMIRLVQAGKETANIDAAKKSPSSGEEGPVTSLTLSRGEGYLIAMRLRSSATGTSLLRAMERMPWLYLASTLSSSTSVGSEKERANLP